MKEDKIINPFDSGLHAVIFQQGDCGVSHITLNAACCSQSFNGHVLDVYTVSPADTEVFFVSWTDWVSYGRLWPCLEMRPPYPQGKKQA